LYVGFGALDSHTTGSFVSPYFAHDASCVIPNIDWTSLASGTVFNDGGGIKTSSTGSGNSQSP